MRPQSRAVPSSWISSWDRRKQRQCWIQKLNLTEPNLHHSVADAVGHDIQQAAKIVSVGELEGEVVGIVDAGGEAHVAALGREG